MRLRIQSLHTGCVTCAAGLLTLLTGCMVGPNYHKPTTQAPPTFQEQHAGQAKARKPGDGKWWQVFSDPLLNRLEDEAATTNQDVRIAVANVDQADAVRRAVGSYRYPTIAAQPQVGRTRYAQDRPNNGSSNGTATVFTDAILPLTLGYEIDAWGRIRRQVRSASATEQASANDLQFIRLVIAASVATDYFNVREADAEAKIVAETTTGLQRGYQITSDQFHKGVISELPVKQAEAVLEQAHAQTRTIQLRRSQAEHAVAVMIGIPAEDFHLPVDSTPTSEPSIPPGLPAAMLERRPDVQAAERRAASASEQVGVATADYYPRFILTGSAGVESVASGSLFDWQNTIASLIASATQPVFSGGRLRANVDQAKAAYAASLATYEKAVIAAHGDVEDQLSAVGYLDAQARDEQAVVASARRSAEIAEKRYRAGLVSYLEVVFAQQTLLQNEQVLSQVQGQQSNATVALIRALGGGW